MSATNTFVKQRTPKAEPVITLTGSADAIDISQANIFVLNRSGAVNSATLAAPTDVLDDDRVIWIKNGTTQANTVTIGEGLGGSGGSYDVLTFANVVAANCTLRAYGGHWFLIGQYGITVS
jgi:hypothetical protein